MADTQTKEELRNELLVGLSRIYAFVKSREYTKSLSSFTFDTYIAQAKDQIKKENKGNRPSKLERLDRLESDISKCISQARQLKNDTNTEST